jgi:hypothetical protein
MIPNEDEVEENVKENVKENVEVDTKPAATHPHKETIKTGKEDPSDDKEYKNSQFIDSGTKRQRTHLVAALTVRK